MERGQPDEWEGVEAGREQEGVGHRQSIADSGCCRKMVFDGPRRAVAELTMADLVIRRPWPKAFPDVVVHSDVRTRDGHEDYKAAKSGNADSALALALDLIDIDSAAERLLANIIGDRSALLLPVVADEVTGFNAIPDAMAFVLAHDLRLSYGLDVKAVSGEIVQTNKVGHTRAPSFQRLVTPAAFNGNVEPGENYILVDDHVGLGGTLASLRGYVEGQGGVVIAITTLTESRDARRIALRMETLTVLRERHGQDLEQLWQTQFGYGLDCLTEIEALNLCRQPSVDAIEDFLAQAAVEARGRGLDPAVG